MNLETHTAALTLMASGRTFQLLRTSQLKTLEEFRGTTALIRQNDTFILGSDDEVRSFELALHRMLDTVHWES